MGKVEQKLAAKELFFLNWDQTEIARVVNVTNATVSKWVNQEKWREERALKYSLKESIGGQLMELIDYQLSALREKVKTYKESGDLKLLDKGEIDALSKMFASVKQKDVQWTHYVNVCRELCDYVDSKDSDFAKALLNFTDGFLMQKRERLM